MTVKAIKTRKSVGRKAGDVESAIAARLEEERGRRDLTQTEFAEGAGIGQGTYSVYERALIPRAWLILRDLAEAYDIDLNYLLRGRKGNGR